MSIMNILKVGESVADLASLAHHFITWGKSQKAEAPADSGKKKDAKPGEEAKEEKKKEEIKFPWFNRKDEIAFSTLMLSGRLQPAEVSILDRFIVWLRDTHPFKEANFIIHFATQSCEDRAKAEESLFELAHVGLDLPATTADAARYQAMFVHCEARQYTTDNISKALSALKKSGVNSVNDLEAFLLRPGTRTDPVTGAVTATPSPMQSALDTRRRLEEWRHGTGRRRFLR